MKNKGVSEIIAVVLILLMSAGLLGTALNWGLPMISKRQDTTTSERIYDYFNPENSDSIGRKMEFVAKNGGQETFISTVDGLWSLTCTSADQGDGCTEYDILQFVTTSKVSNIAVSTVENDIGWISMSSGGSCPPVAGSVGIDDSYVVCAKSEPFGEGFNMTYRLWFRELYDYSDTKIWEIGLVKHESGELIKNTNIVKIIKNGVTTGSQSGKTLITTEIKILLL